MTVRGISCGLALILIASCSAGGESPTASSSDPTERTSTTSTIEASTSTTSTPEPAVSTTSAPDGPSVAGGDTTPDSDSRPDWLGTRPLELRPDGFGVVLPTPPELIDRSFPPSSSLGPGGDEFAWSSGPVPTDVQARSTWDPSCPVALEDLAYLTMTYRGFDGASHVGEMIVNASVAEDVVDVFRRMFESDFPIEEMLVVAPDELDAPPTGDGNNTTAFVCRPVTGATSWSQHAYGLAIDVNPFHNPYVKGDLVLPELASYYVDRTRGLPGMITEGDAVVAAFDSIGWGWGGRWSSLKDYQHFSANGR